MSSLFSLPGEVLNQVVDGLAQDDICALSKLSRTSHHARSLLLPVLFGFLGVNNPERDLLPVASLLFREPALASGVKCFRCGHLPRDIQASPFSSTDFISDDMLARAIANADDNLQKIAGLIRRGKRLDIVLMLTLKTMTNLVELDLGVVECDDHSRMLFREFARRRPSIMYAAFGAGRSTIPTYDYMLLADFFFLPCLRRLEILEISPIHIPPPGDVPSTRAISHLCASLRSLSITEQCITRGGNLGNILRYAPNLKCLTVVDYMSTNAVLSPEWQDRCDIAYFESVLGQCRYSLEEIKLGRTRNVVFPFHYPFNGCFHLDGMSELKYIDLGPDWVLAPRVIGRPDDALSASRILVRALPESVRMLRLGRIDTLASDVAYYMHMLNGLVECSEKEDRFQELGIIAFTITDLAPLVIFVEFLEKTLELGIVVRIELWRTGMPTMDKQLDHAEALREARALPRRLSVPSAP